ncbi:MAG TPA: DMT family transporter [Actinocrinis sp.]|nr:DMT family transporter [Actinocrinis sp.]
MPALLAIVASALWGTGDYVGGLLSRRISSLAVVFLGMCTALVAVGALAVVVRPPLGLNLLDGAAAGVAGAVGLVCFYRAMATGPMSVVAPLSATGTAIPVLWDLANGASANAVQGAGMLLAFAGVILAGGPEWRRSPDTARSTLLFTLVAAIGFGLYFIFVAAGSQTSVLSTLLGQRAAGVLFLAVPALRGWRSGASALSGLRERMPRKYLALLMVGGLFDVSANGIYGVSTSLPGADLAVVTVLASLYPVMTTLLARGLLKERLRSVQNLGVIAALAGVLLLNA